MAMTDLTIRDWMVIIGVLLILAVMLDAWRRIRNDRRTSVRMELAELPDDDEQDDIGWFKELPNGGARVVERGDLLRAAGHSTGAGREDDAVTPGRDRGAQGPAQDSAEDDAEDDADQDALVAGMSTAGESVEPDNIDWLDGFDSGEQPSEEIAQPGRLPRDVDPEVFMLNVVARDPRGFKGDDILHILLACDLRFGDMNFFHRHEFEAGRGAIQFSVANMMQPGVFDIDNMADFSTPGLVFFLTLPGPEDMMKAFDYMLETAQAVAKNLGGDVLDESRSVLTRQSMEHNRQKIRDLERRLLARAR